MENELQVEERSKNSKSRDVLIRLKESFRQANVEEKDWRLQIHRWTLERDKSDVLGLLSTYDYDKAYRQIRRDCTPSTSEWIYSTPEYQGWVTEAVDTLWVTGRLGPGKSVMSACVVTHLKQDLSPADVVAFYFCHFEETISLNADTIIGSIARQLVKDCACREIPGT